MALVVNSEYVEDGRFIEAFRQMGGFDIDPVDASRQHEAVALRHLAERRVVELVLLRQMASEAGFAVSAKEVSALRAISGVHPVPQYVVPLCSKTADDLLVEKYCHWLSRPRASPVAFGS